MSRKRIESDVESKLAAMEYLLLEGLEEDGRNNPNIRRMAELLNEIPEMTIQQLIDTFSDLLGLQLNNKEAVQKIQDAIMKQISQNNT